MSVNEGRWRPVGAAGFFLWFLWFPNGSSGTSEYVGKDHVELRQRFGRRGLECKAPPA